jgi:hypothetical protein
LTTDRLDQRTIGFATRLGPADRFFLGGTTSHKTGGVQTFFNLRNSSRPLGAHAVQDDILKHSLPFHSLVNFDSADHPIKNGSKFVARLYTAFIEHHLKITPVAQTPFHAVANF